MDGGIGQWLLMSYTWIVERLSTLFCINDYCSNSAASGFQTSMWIGLPISYRQKDESWGSWTVFWMVRCHQWSATGSVLGPIVFTVREWSSRLDSKQYADVCWWYKSLVYDQLSGGWAGITEWSRQSSKLVKTIWWLLQFNSSKYKVMHVGHDIPTSYHL